VIAVARVGEIQPLTDANTITAVLIELDGIANAPMTGFQRVVRAQPVLSAHGLRLSDLTSVILHPDLPWHRSKSMIFGVTTEQWVDAVRIAGADGCDSLEAFLAAIHRAESAAAMLRAGYRASRDGSGEIGWSR